MKTGYSVADAMTTRPVTIPPDITVRDASRVMRDHDVGSLLVVDAERTVLGIIIADDIVHRVTAEARKSAETMIKDVMTTELVDIGPEADIYEAMVLMREHDIMHLPVRDPTGKLLGFLTMKDVLKIEPELFSVMVEMAETKSGRTDAISKDGYCQECGNYSEDLQLVDRKLVCSVCRGN